MCLWAIYTYIFPRSVCLFCCRKICGPMLEIYKTLTDTWMWKLCLRPRNSFMGIHKWDFRVFKNLFLVKGKVSRDFLLLVFSWLSFSQASDYTITPFQILTFAKMFAAQGWPPPVSTTRVVNNKQPVSPTGRLFGWITQKWPKKGGQPDKSTAEFWPILNRKGRKGVEFEILRFFFLILGLSIKNYTFPTPRQQSFLVFLSFQKVGGRRFLFSAAAEFFRKLAGKLCQQWTEVFILRQDCTGVGKLILSIIDNHWYGDKVSASIKNTRGGDQYNQFHLWDDHRYCWHRWTVRRRCKYSTNCSWGLLGSLQGGGNGPMKKS